MRNLIFYAVVGIVSVTLPAAVLARGEGGSKAPQHSDLSVSQKSDKSSPSVMDTKTEGKFTPNDKRSDPYKNFKFSDESRLAPRGVSKLPTARRADATWCPPRSFPTKRSLRP